MLLKSLELSGFKSFADKTVIDLTHKITAVVGPNGSGKSNITDAVRWLLGERDARNLRGGKVEDLIFAGTEKKPRMGQASATLYFDNTSRLLPVEFNEVSISRRVSRDGVSTFLLNRTEVRLKDVVDFFAKSKLGARGLTIITQGSSDMFIRATPVERKEMIEEILGLKEFQIKKTDSIRKLKNTAINLETVNASLEELKPHLRFLKRQVARYEERDNLVLELKLLEDAFYGRKARFLRTDILNHKAQLERIEALLKEEAKSLEAIQLELENIKKSEPESAQDFHSIEKEKRVALSKRSELQKELGKLEARVEFEAESGAEGSVDALKVLHSVRQIAESIVGDDDIHSIKSKIRELLKKIGEAFRGKDEKRTNEVSPELKALGSDLAAKLSLIDEEIDGLSRREDEIRAGLSGFNKTFTAKYEESEIQRKKVDGLVNDKNRLGFDIEKSELRIQGLAEELSQAGRSLESIEQEELKDLPSGMTDEEAMRRMFKLRGDLSGIGDIDQNLIKEARESEERFNFLTNQVSDLEAAVQDLKVIIRDLDQKIHHDFTSAIKTINEEFLKLMRIMFGGGTAKLVVRTIDDNRGAPGEGPEDKPEEAAPEVREAEEDLAQGIEVEVSLPKKRIKGLDVLSGGERTLVSIAVLFALISVSPPPFLVLDEVDAALDEGNARRVSQVLKEFSKRTQFVIVTHNRATMEVADVLYGVTMQEDGTSRLLSIKLEDAPASVAA